MGPVRLAGSLGLAKQAPEFFHNRIGPIWDHLSLFQDSKLPW